MNEHGYDSNKHDNGIIAAKVAEQDLPDEVLALRGARLENEKLRAALAQRAEEVGRENQIMREYLDGHPQTTRNQYP